MSATARPKSPCARRSSPSKAASRSPCWRRRPFWRSNTCRPFAIAFAISRCASKWSAASSPPKKSRRSAGDRQGQSRYRHRHPSVAAKRRRIQRFGSGHRRRRAPLRRGAQGTAQKAAPARRRSQPHRDADPAHAAHVAGRYSRLEHHRNAAGGSPGDSNLRDPLR